MLAVHRVKIRAQITTLTMEVPDNIKQLFRHWDAHVGRAQTTTSDIPNVPEEIRWFINERIRMWEHKVSGGKPPHTQDAILSSFRFCNIFREFDRQTMEIHTQLNELRGDFPLWLLNMFYARMVARPATVQHAGLLSFDTEHNRHVYDALMSAPRPKFGTPYVFPISVIQKSDTPTRELFIAQYLPYVMKDVAKEIQTWRKESVHEGVEKVLTIFGFNFRFLWTEVLIDVAYQFPELLDLFARFPVGPGSVATFRKIAPGKDPSLIVAHLGSQRIPTGISYNNKPLVLSAENWEGIGCEYRKYVNLRQGNGRRRYYRAQ